jgi:hypothetical protein
MNTRYAIRKIMALVEAMERLMEVKAQNMTVFGLAI